MTVATGTCSAVEFAQVISQSPVGRCLGLRCRQQTETGLRLGVYSELAVLSMGSLQGWPDERQLGNRSIVWSEKLLQILFPGDP